MRKAAPKSAAILTIVRAADMTVEGRREIARWLRRQARFLSDHGGNMSDRFVARYRYLERDDAQTPAE